MRVLLVHPSALMYSEIYLRLEPLGMERVAAALRAAGHDVRLLDLQVHRHDRYWRALHEFDPQAVGYSLNYLANVPEVIDLARATRSAGHRRFLFVGGHSVSFIARQVLDHAGGAIDAVVRGEGEIVTPRLLEAAQKGGVTGLEGVATPDGDGPRPTAYAQLDEHLPARDLLDSRRRYFIGVLDPCASIEFSRGCPWDCSFCSAWTFYGRNYRKVSPDAAAWDLSRIREPGVFIVDDVAFIRPEHGFEIGREVERRRVRKEYYLETRCDVLVRHEDVFAYWKRLGLTYMFLGLEALDEEGLKRYRKRTSTDINLKALDVARRLGITVAINIIADPDWDEERFRWIREWALSVPEIVHLTVQTPYPGTETWYTESRRLTTLDYRLFDVQHAVLPTRLPLRRFYEELVTTQAVLARKHLGKAAIMQTAGIVGRHLLHGQTNFVRSLWKFGSVYNAARQSGDHEREARYLLPEPPARASAPGRGELFVHAPARRTAAH